MVRSIVEINLIGNHQICSPFQVVQCRSKCLVQELQLPKVVVVEGVDNSSRSAEDNNQPGREEMYLVNPGI